MKKRIQIKKKQQFNLIGFTLLLLFFLPLKTSGQQKNEIKSPLATKNEEQNKLSSTQDDDNDGIPNNLDNCPTIWNPQQKDINQNGIGDPCDPMTKIISFFDNSPIGFGYSTEFLFQEKLNIHTLIEETKTFVLRNDTIFLDKILDYEKKDYYKSKIVLNNSAKDTMDVLIFVDFVIKDYLSSESNLKLEENSIGTYTVQQIEPAYNKNIYEKSTYYGNLDIGSFLRSVFEDSFFIVEDIDSDGTKDLVLGQTRINHQGHNLNTHQITIPTYLIRNGEKYTIKRNSFSNKSVFHTPTIFNQTDINKEGRKEIINFGEHYHALTPNHHSFYKNNKSYLRYLGLSQGLDYNQNDFKLLYYYKWANSELEATSSKYIYKDSTEISFLSSYSNAIGDFNNDGYLDYVLTSQSNGKFNYVLDVMINNREGAFIVNRKEITNYFGSEGEGLLIDVNGDGFKDFIVGGGERTRPGYSTVAVFYNNKNNHFDPEYKIIDIMYEGLGLRSTFESDLDQDGQNEIIAYFSTGYGSNGGGLTLDKAPNLIKIYKIENGEIKDVSSLYFQNGENIMNFYTQTGFLKHIDLDGDGHKDLVPRFNIEEPDYGWNYPGNAFRGLWNNSRGFQYFKFDPVTKKFKVVDLGPIKTNAPNNSSPYLYNYFDFVNFDSEQYLNWITVDKGTLIKITPSYILPLTKEIELKINQVQESTSLSWTSEPHARDYNLKLFDADRILLDTTLKTTNFEIINYRNYPTVFQAKVKSQNVLNSGAWSKDVEIKDVLPPLLKAVEKLTVTLEPDGKGQITIGMVDLGTKDNQKLTELNLSKTSFTCADLGTSKITFTAKDASGNTSAAEVTITVVDEVKPTLKAKAAYTIRLDAEGKAALKWEDLDEGSSDNCSIKDKLLSKTSFICADLGTNKVTFTARDASGNSSSAEVTVTVVDEIKPTLKSKSSYVIKLDVEGKATLKWEDIDEGSSENCSITERTLSKTDFTRTDGGDNKVTYTLTDASGNSSSVDVNVRVDIVLSNPERNSQTNTVNAYPNPVDDYLSLVFAEGVSYASIQSTDLVDATGKVLASIKLEDLGEGKLGFSTAHLKGGLYFLRLSTRDTLHLIKFTVIH